MTKLERHFRGVSFALLCLLLPSPAWSADVLLTPKESAWLQAHPEWRGVGSSSLPIQWIDKDGTYRGIAADYDKLLARKLGVSIDAVYAESWPASVEQLKRREVDLCTLLIRTPEREEYLNFSREVTVLPTAVLVREGMDDLNSVNDLMGHSVAVPRMWAIELNLKRDYPQLDLQPFTTVDEALMAVSTGKTAAYAGDLASTSYAMEKLGITNLKVSFMLPYTLSLCVGVRKDWPEAIPILNKAIASIGEDEHKTIRTRWAGLRSEGLSSREVMNIVVPIFAALALLCLGAYIFSLRREILLRRAAQQEVLNTENATIVALAALAETRDNDTGGHLRRTQEYVKALALKLRQQGLHADMLTDFQIELLYNTAPLHDIGKVGIPDKILQKPGKLTMEEIVVMRTHTTIGAAALERAEKECRAESRFLRQAREIILTHHERWDGTGYPQGLKGPAIPLGGRLMAVADVYDALRSVRCYKEAMEHDEVVEAIRKERGCHFDPEVVDAFLVIEKKFLKISRVFIDHPQEAAGAG